MKKFITGIIVGIIISISTVGIASNQISAYLFPVKFTFNGEQKILDSQYDVLNYKGYTYVPSRYIAENMNGYIYYDEISKTVNVSFLEEPIITDFEGYFPNVKVGSISLNKLNNDTKVSGYYKVEDDPTENTISFALNFYNEDGDKIGTVSVSGNLKPNEIGQFSTVIKGDITNYKKISMQLGIYDEVVKRGISE